MRATKLTCHLAGRKSYDLRPDTFPESAKCKSIFLDTEEFWTASAVTHRTSCALGTLVPTILAAATAILILSLSTGTASMAGSHSSSPSTYPSSVDLELKLFGKIKPSCEIHFPKEKLWFEMTDDADMRAVTFDLNCNQPLKVEVSSRNGGLQHSAHDRLPTYPGFTSFVEYDLGLALQAPGTNDLRFDSEDIKSEPGRGHFGAIPHDTKGELKISWVPTENLIAGTYGDVIEIRVTGDSGSNGHW